jgi:hypothetical protein
MTTLLLQILGNSDVEYEGGRGSEKLRGKSKEEFLNYISNKISPNKINFPIIKKLNNNLSSSETDILFCFILTDQSDWLKNHARINFKSVAKKDGIHWENSLKDWCKQQKINCHTIQFLVNPNTDNGVADWEDMAQDIEKLLNNYIEFSEDSMGFKSTNNNENERLNLLPVPIDKIIIQHSSGTPALSSSLYLWGIERKIEGRNIEFVYVSEQDEDEDEDENNCEIHSGSHWQWRLKVPQIQELLKIQDFSGAIQLVKTHQEYQQLEDILNSLKNLDHAVSLNLSGYQFSAPKDAMIERIAIALWSETAFRERGQWMHWYLRVAGAFELSILLLLEKQSQGAYTFEYKENKENKESPKKINLIYNYNNLKIPIALVNISSIVDNLLTKGEFEFEYRYREKKEDKTENIKLECEKVSDDKWENFRINFYINNWKLDSNKGSSLGFLSVRNNLYHSLMGEYIDESLDSKTKNLGDVKDSNHPSQIAINHLEYIIELSSLKDKVKNQVNAYKQKVEDLQELLK